MELGPALSPDGSPIVGITRVAQLPDIPPRPEAVVGISSTETKALILDEIAADGPMTHARFMDLSLAGPGGFYAAGNAKINGYDAHFSTGALSPEFAEDLTEGYYKYWAALGRPATFRIREAGAGMGTMAKHSLTYAYLEHPDMFEALEYHIQDFAGMHQRQYDMIAGTTPINVTDCRAERNTKWQHRAHLSKMRWHDGSILTASLGSLDNTLITSNELLDAFGAEVTTRSNGDLQQKYIDAPDGKNLSELWGPLTPAVREYIDTYRIAVPEGSVRAVNLAAAALQRHIDGQFAPNDKGGMITIDYSINPNSPVAKRPVRYFPPDADALANPGEVDITTDVDFDVQRQIAEEDGMRIAFLGGQNDFLLAASRPRLERTRRYDPTIIDKARERAAKNIIQYHTFRVLALAHNVDVRFDFAYNSSS